MKKTNMIFQLFLILFVLPQTVFAASNYYVVANIGNIDNSISKSELRDVYLGKKTFWPDNSRVNFSLVNHGNPNTEKFIAEVLDQSSDEFNRYWRRKLFSGSGVPPQRFNSEQELLEFVGKQKGAIGIVYGASYRTQNLKYLPVN